MLILLKGLACYNHWCMFTLLQSILTEWMIVPRVA